MITVSDEDAQNLADALERSLRAMKSKGPEYVEHVKRFIEFFRAGGFQTI
jgi:hypothetical protein